MNYYLIVFGTNLTETRIEPFTITPAEIVRTSMMDESIFGSFYLILTGNNVLHPALFEHIFLHFYRILLLQEGNRKRIAFSLAKVSFSVFVDVYSPTAICLVFGLPTGKLKQNNGIELVSAGFFSSVAFSVFA